MHYLVQVHSIKQVHDKYIIREMRLGAVYKRGQLATSRKNAAAW